MHVEASGKNTSVGVRAFIPTQHSHTHAQEIEQCNQNFLKRIVCAGTSATCRVIILTYKYQIEPILHNNHSSLDLADTLLLNVTLLGRVRAMDVTLGRGPGLMRLPARGGARSGLGKHLVDLLERETLGLGDEEVRKERRADGSRTPDEEDLGAELELVLGDEVWRDDTDNAVPELWGHMSAQRSIVHIGK